MHRISSRFAFVFTLLSVTSFATAATLHVPTDHATIQGCIDAAVSGEDECVVAPGTYVESINFNGKAITLRSSDGAEVTTIDGNGAFHVVQCVSGEGPDTVLEGFTITGGAATGDSAIHENTGGGMLNIETSPSIRNCMFINNVASGDGGGMSNRDASPTVSHCTFLNNESTDGSGGGIANYTGTPVFTHCKFVGNASDLSGGGVFNLASDTSLANCLFDRNTSEIGGGLSNSSCSPSVRNCTFHANIALYFDVGSAIYNSEGSSPLIVNSIISSGRRESNAIRNANGTVDKPTIRFCVAKGLVPGAASDGGGNITDDPLFVDPEGLDGVPGTLDDDLRLGPCSRAVDAGTNSELEPGMLTDLAGSPRLADDAGVKDAGLGSAPIVDMGAFERQDISGPQGIAIVETGSFYCGIQEAINSATDGDEIVVAPGTYNEAINFNGKAIILRSSQGPEVTTIDGAGFGSSVVRCANGEGPQTVLLGFTITGGNAGSYLWPYGWCGGGMFSLDSSPTVKDCKFVANDLVVNTIAPLNGGGMFNFGGSPTIANCVFEANKVRNTNGLGTGGGMFIGVDGSPAVIDCVFKENVAYYGGGIAIHYDVATKVTNCDFLANTAYEGGGLFVEGSDSSVTGCLFVGNSASRFGAAMYNRQFCYPSVTSCTFFGNSAGELGGAMYNHNWVEVQLTNSILAGNWPNDLSHWDRKVDATYVRYSSIQGPFGNGTVDNGGNIISDPMFVRVPDDGGDGWGDYPGTPDVDEGANNDYGDLRLQAESPCINTGSAALLPADEADIDGDGDVLELLPLDLDGHARVLCGEVDMGTYEFGIGDYDCNGAVDLTDFASWAMCMIEPGGGSYPEGCEALDFDADGVITLRDFAGFQTALGG